MQLPIFRREAGRDQKMDVPNFSISNRIYLFLGADIYDHIVLEMKNRHCSVFLRETIFGWIVAGCKADCQRLNRVRSFYVVSDFFDLSKFWQLEEVAQY